jgi:20S proteasome subunit alpha 6
MSSRMLYNRPLPISRIVGAIADSTCMDSSRPNGKVTKAPVYPAHTEAQVNTQHYGRRPYGVGLLVAGYDVRLSSHSQFVATNSLY